MMDTQLISRLLWKRGRLRRRDRWPRRRLEEHQARALGLLRKHAQARSHFYRRFHRGLTERLLYGLPVLSKEMLMQHFDELVDRLRRELEAQGVIVPPFKVRRVPDVARTALGKAPLIRSATTTQEEAT